MTHTYKCPDCGSESLVFDAAMTWDKGRQMFYLETLYDTDAYCIECEDTVREIRVETDEECISEIP